MARSHGREQDWVEWEVKGKVSGQSRAAEVRVAEDQGGKPLGNLRPGGQRPSGPRAKSIKSTPSPQERQSESFVLRTYIVCGIGEKSYILING